MMNNIPSEHPRAESLLIREKLIEGFHTGAVTSAGLIAHGRGEAFDYLLGEKTPQPAMKAIKAAAATLLNARKPIISVNGNAAALTAGYLVKLADVIGAKIEVNLFYRSVEREQAIEKMLYEAGAKEILGVGKNASAKIPELSSERRRVDPQGILKGDVVLVPLEDGDRTEALARLGKRIIAIDLNPLSRTAKRATITIVDNIVRAMPELITASEHLKKQNAKKREKILVNFNNKKNLEESIALINSRLSKIARSGKPLVQEDEEHDL